MTNADRQQLVAWLESRYKDTTMPGAKRMFKLALDAIREKPANDPLTCKGCRHENHHWPSCSSCARMHTDNYHKDSERSKNNE